MNQRRWWNVNGPELEEVLSAEYARQQLRDCTEANLYDVERMRGFRLGVVVGVVCGVVVSVLSAWLARVVG